MNLKTSSILLFVCALAVSGVSYLVSQSFYVPLIFFVLFCLDYLILYKKMKKYFTKTQRIHECYHFINSFLVSLSIRDSYDDSFDSAVTNPSPSMEAELKAIDNLSSVEKLDYLRKYFNLSIYKMFLNVLDIYNVQGGNILEIGNSLMNESVRMEEATTQTSHFNIRKAIEFIVLWGMTILIMVFMWFAMRDFYAQMASSLMYQILLYVFFLLVLGSIHYFVAKVFVVSIKEDNLNE